MNIDLFEITQSRSYDYSLIKNNKKSIINVSDDKRLINFIIGVKGMTQIFRATLENIVESWKKSKHHSKIKITLVEQDDVPLNDYFCNKLGVDYIFIPQNICNTFDMHSTALMYNVGFLFTKKSDWYIFHCADLIIPKNYFDILIEKYIPSKPMWVQCFTKKRVKLLSPEATGKYLNNEIPIFPEEFSNEMFLKDPESGAPGGSILVKYDTFVSVGGYDDELFYGYTFEDTFFWLKLEVILHNSNVTKIHSGKAIYADVPAIELCHLQKYKEVSQDLARNKDFKMHEKYWKIFSEEFDILQKSAYIRLKRNNIQKYLNLHA